MTLETFGSLIKEEHVKTVEHDIVPNTLVLENLDAFPGYYGAHLPHDKVPDSFFLVMTKKESTEKILRITYNIRKHSQIKFEGSPASICISNNTYYSIRLRGLTDFAQLSVIQEFYRDAGMIFAKRKNVDSRAVIQIKKVFRVENLTPDILKGSEPFMYYLKINQQLNWSHFKTITKQLRNNIDISAFDAALAVIYSSEVLDLIRIYTKTLTTEELQRIHEKYNELIAKS